MVQFDTSLGSFRVTLEDAAKPITVTNFLNYVNNDRYVDSFIHRVAHNSDSGVEVIQGGGFRFTNGSTNAVQKDNAIQNEPGLSNVRGTIAMAKTSDPNSATSEWFINVTDNLSLNNPANSGGFTVFGHVLGNGMTVVDAISAAQRVNAGSPFGQLPVINYSGGNVTGNNLIFTAVEVVADVAPSMAPLADQSIAQGQTLTLDVPIQDADAPLEQLQFTLVSGPAGAAFERLSATSGRFTWTPPASTAPGGYSATVRVTDLSGKTAEQPIALTLTDSAPTGRIDDVPLTNSVSQLTLRFTESVSGVDIGDLRLTRDGGGNLLTSAQTLTTTDNIVYTLNNVGGLTDAAGVYQLSVVAGSSNILDGANHPLAADAARSWQNVGPVMQSLIGGQALSGQLAAYRIVPNITGGLTAEFLLDPQQGSVTSFRLVDPAGGTPPQANFAPDGSSGRIDYLVTAGQPVWLVVEGNHPDVALRFSNLIELNDATKRVVLHGLPGNDTMAFRIEADRLLFDFNDDLTYFFMPEAYETIVFMGGGGADSVTLSGGAGGDMADIFAGGGFLQGTIQVGSNTRNFRFEAAQTELVVVEGATGDTLTLRGSASDDLFVVRPGQFTSAAAAGLAVGRGFSTVNFIPGIGGNDRVVLYGSSGADELTVSNAGFSLSGPGYQAAIQGVGQLRAFAGDGVDQLIWNGGDDPTSVIAGPTQIQIQSGAFTGTFFGFERFTANKGTGSATVAWLDSTQAEILVADLSMTRWTGPGFDFRTNNFNTARAYSSAGSDMAIFNAPADSGAQFTNTAAVARLIGANSTTEAQGFAVVRGPAPAAPSSSAALAAIAGTSSADEATALALALRFSLAAEESAALLIDAAFDEPGDWLK